MGWNFLLAARTRAGELASALRAEGACVEICDPGQLGSALPRFSPDACVVELGESKPEVQLLDLLSKEEAPPVLVLSGPDPAAAVKAVRAGASSALPSSADPGLVAATLIGLARQGALSRELAARRARQARKDEWVLEGNSAAARRLAAVVERVSSTPRTTVLVSGPSGSGKRSVARLIHWRSARSRGPLIEVEAGERPRAATVRPGSRRRDRAGVDPLAQGEGGTLLIAGVEHLDDAAQAWLASLLGNRGVAESGPDVRVVATTSGDLTRWVEEGRFREDLLYRLNVLTLRVPALEERSEDLPVLVQRLLEELAEAEGRGPLELAPETAQALAGRAWPGNLRELALEIRLAALRSDGARIEASALQPSVDARPWELPRPAAVLPGGIGDPELLGAQQGGTLRAVEEALIRRVIAETGGNKARSSEILGIHRTTLYHKLKSYGIE